MNDTANTQRTAKHVFVVSFALNLAWENAHAPLYQKHGARFLPMRACLTGVLGDATFTTLLYLGVTRAKRDPWWFTRSSRATWTAATSVGLLVAAVTEIVAIRRGLWSYGPRMPRVPLLGVGITPLVQLATLSIVTFKLLRKITEPRRIPEGPSRANEYHSARSPFVACLLRFL